MLLFYYFLVFQISKRKNSRTMKMEKVILRLLIFLLKYTILVDAACPKQLCECDEVVKQTVCIGVSNSSALAEVSKNLDNKTETLLFIGNRLKAFDVPFNLPNLLKLDLTDNLLSTFPVGLSEMFPSLKVLILNDNIISTLSPSDFRGLEQVDKLSLEKNKLTKIDSGTFRTLNGLNQLLLSDNQITTLSPDAFEGLSNLVNLNLDHNKLSNLPSKIFDYFVKKYIRISLVRNLLNTIPNSLFEKLSNFKIFDATSNLITKVGNKAFNGITAEMISLGNNSIKSIIPDSFLNSSIVLMHLDRNPLFCPCELSKVTDFVKILVANCTNVPVKLSVTSQFEELLCTICDKVDCHNNGVCLSNGKVNYTCECTDSYSGINCEILNQRKEEGLSTAAIVGIVLGVVFIILVLLAAFFYCQSENQQHREKNQHREKDQHGEMKPLKNQEQV